MLALACLVSIGTAIVVGRLLYNGSRETATAPGQTAAIPRASVKQRRRKAAPATKAARGAPATVPEETAPTAPERWPGGACPACGNATVPGAKFCGECGSPLVPG